MFENFIGFFKKFSKKEGQLESKTNKDEAKERLHLVLMQDRANVSADFLDMMRQEIIDVIKKYIDVDEGDIDVRLTNKQNSDGTTGAPALYANIPIKSIKNEVKQEVEPKEENKQEEIKEEKTQENTEKENKEEKEDNTNSNEIVEEKEKEEKNKEEVKEEKETKPKKKVAKATTSKTKTKAKKSNKKK